MQKLTLLISLLAIFMSSYSIYVVVGIEKSEEMPPIKSIVSQDMSLGDTIVKVGTGSINPCITDTDCKKLDSTTKAYTENNPDECKSLEDPKMIATCVDHISFIKAVESKDKNSCKKIDEKSTQEDCEKYIEALKNN